MVVIAKVVAIFAAVQDAVVVHIVVGHPATTLARRELVRVPRTLVIAIPGAVIIGVTKVIAVLLAVHDSVLINVHIRRPAPADSGRDLRGVGGAFIVAVPRAVAVVIAHVATQVLAIAVKRGAPFGQLEQTITALLADPGRRDVGAV